MKRRSFLGLMALSGSLGFGYPSVGASKKHKEWEGFGYDLRNSSYNTTTNIAEEVGIKWKHRTGNSVLSSPSVVNGTVYVGSWGENLYAFDTESGDVKWRFKTESSAPYSSYGGRVGSSPYVADGMVVFGSWDGYVYAVDTESGNEVWRFDASSMVRSSPIINDDTVYIGDWAGKMNALSLEDGTKLWSYETGRDHIYSTPCFGEDCLYFGAMDSNPRGGPEGGELHAVDADSGERLWEFTENGGVGSSPSLHEGTLYFGSFDNNVYAVDSESGEEIWSFETGDRIASSPAVDGERVYIGSWDNSLYALDLDDGSLSWSYSTDDRLYASNVTATEDAVYFGSHDGYLRAVEPEDGTLVWEFETGGRVRSGATLVGDTVYFGSWDGNVYALTENQESTNQNGRKKDTETPKSSEELYGILLRMLDAIDSISIS